MRHLRTLAAGLFMSLALGAVVQADSFAVDPVHSAVLFKVKHMNTANFYGRFATVEGAVKEDNGALTSVEASIPVESINTNNKDRDEHVKSPDFFDAKQYPTITFASTAVKKLDTDKYEVTGNLTLHGQTKPVTVTLMRTGSGQNVKKQDIVGYETTFTIKRSDYGVSGYLPAIGDEVTLTVSLESTKQ